MKEIDNVLLDVKNNPTMMLGENSIRKLGLFIHAYIYSISRSGRDEEMISRKIDLFRIWLKNKFKIKHPIAWHEILVFVFDDEWDALQKFWPLWDKFSESPKYRTIKKKPRKTESNPAINNDLFSLLKDIQKKPVMYLQYESLSNLVAFLNGYVYALRKMGMDKSKEEIEFEKFTYWISKNYQKEGKIFLEKPWWKSIRFFSENDCQALHVFFDLFDKFTRSVKNM